MASTLSARSSSALLHDTSDVPAGFRASWREWLARIFDPYRPELHYMRGPGPAWRAKHGDAAAFRLPPMRES